MKRWCGSSCAQNEGIHATLRVPVEPGGSYYGHSYEALRALGSGAHDRTFPAPHLRENPGLLF
jgi:hypothetical protein